MGHRKTIFHAIIPIFQAFYSNSLFYRVHLEDLDPKQYKLLPIAYCLLPSV